MKTVRMNKIDYVTSGRIISNGFIGCFGVMGYFRKGENKTLVLSHHSPNEFIVITAAWANFKAKHQELSDYDYGEIIIARVEPIPEGNPKNKQHDGTFMTYTDRLEAIIKALKVQHPKAKVKIITYQRESFFLGDLNSLAWETNLSQGRFEDEN